MVRDLNPKRRLAGRTPFAVAYSSPISRSCTRSRYRLGPAASRITANHSRFGLPEPPYQRLVRGPFLSGYFSDIRGGRQPRASRRGDRGATLRSVVHLNPGFREAAEFNPGYPTLTLAT